MALVISLNYEVERPQTLFVLESEEAVKEHAIKFCRERDLTYYATRNRSSISDSEERFCWAWPRDIDGVWKGPGRWVWRYSGEELSRVELHTYVNKDDLLYLMTRVRGMRKKVKDENETHGIE